MYEATVDEAGGGGVKAEEGGAGAGTCRIGISLNRFQPISQLLPHKGWLGQR